MTIDIRANLERTRERIARAAERSGRSPETVRLVAIAKTFPVAGSTELSTTVT